MDVSQFLDQCLILDTEVNEKGEIFAIGAVFGDRVFTCNGRFDAQAALGALDAFGQEALYVLGHNLLQHDLPILRALNPNLKFLAKPVVDTLFLSPLAFPENPYHRLVKDYKLVRDSLNDPVADARLAAGVFRDQWESFAALATTEAETLSLYHYCLGVDELGRGLAAVLEAIGAMPVSATRAFDLLQNRLLARVCRKAFVQVAVHHLTDPARRIPLAYCLAWLRVAGGNSVLPPWVLHRFPDVAAILRQLRDVPCADPACDYCRHIHDPVGQLRRYFGFSEFRREPRAPDGTSLQQAIVTQAMGDRPLFAILPTGGGKSLCFQLPALVRYQRRGVLTVVVSPLQALMKDQVDNLRNKTGAPSAAALYGLLTAPERGEVLEGVRLGDIGILYVSPEQLRNRSFSEAIRHREIGGWVFDEAHCLSKWGHDFRPDYLYAARFIKTFAREQNRSLAPVQCFTATAKQDVKAEILDYFRRELGQELAVFEGGVDRKNLSFEVQVVNRAEKYSRIHEMLSERLGPDPAGCAVVYCRTKKGNEQTAHYLQQQGWQAEAFHAGLDPAAKRHVQENFIHGITKVICATTAFGMGIDKDNVRLVIHADMPGSLENYVQEAGRAGRDNEDAECVLLYDEQDVEAQFRLGATSELSQRDIAEILRGLRRAKRNRDGEVVMTSGELVRAEDLQTSFDAADRSADTMVRTAVAWLERAGLVERDLNRTQVFQGRPLVKDMDEARRKIAKREDLSQRKKQRWLAILEALMNAESDAGFSADELAELAPFKADAADRQSETESQRVLRTLYAMAEAGLIRKSLLLTAFVRYKVANHSPLYLERVCRLEQAMLELLPEEAPDADDGSWQSLSLRRLNQRLCDLGYDSNPESLRNLLQSLARDGQGLAGQRGSLDLRHAGQDHFRVKLQRTWQTLRATAKRRQAVARCALATILSRIAPETAPSAELLVEFSAEDILEALGKDPELAGQLKDPLAATDRALMFLHEQRVITLQKGLAVFRQAMTIRILPAAKGRRYGKGDYEPLARHYQERVFQVHVMNEYARRGLEKIGQAVALVLAYFTQDKKDFVRRYFAGRRELLARATGQQSYQRIVEDLGNPAQSAVVAAPEGDNMLILAGPGSGKTRVVVHRCAYLLRVKRARPQSILVLCFNRNAANTLRRRLWALVGPDAWGVTVQTYHGLAMRLTGRSLAARVESGGEEAFDFDELIRSAIHLLRGERDMLGMDPDELRDRLLAGYRYILVDEYQDIDALQYALVSAIAGRTLADPDSKLAILAVGDDDQNIYNFRGANVAFIRRFQEDYQAEVHYLVENYRSSAPIIAAANQLIGYNRDRMKTEQPIRINQARQALPPGGNWVRLDPLVRGRVQILRVEDERHQALALVSELKRLRQLEGAFQWSDCAVLAKEWAVLYPIRAVCEDEGIPVSLALDRGKLPPLHRVREIVCYLETLKTGGEALMRASKLIDLLAEQALDDSEANGTNPWWMLLRRMLCDWKEESGDSELPAKQAVEFIYETLAEQRRDQRLGEGVFLSTVHAAKGMEFRHVFVPDGGWGKAPSGQRLEEERRLYYVAMTRARENLCLLERGDAQNPHTEVLEGDHLLCRQGAVDLDLAAAALGRRYEVLGLGDLYIGFAARRPERDSIHRRLAALRPGSHLHAGAKGDKVDLLDDEDVPVARLSGSAGDCWRERLDRIEEVRVLALVRWRRTDSAAEFRDHCRCEAWEVPIAELVYRPE